MVFDRRRALALLGGAFAGAPRAFAAPTVDGFSGAALYRTVATYSGMGFHRTGSASEGGCSAWFDRNFAMSGFAVDPPDDLRIPLFVPGTCEVAFGGTRAFAFPSWPVVATPADGITGRLTAAGGPLAGKVALVKLPRGAEAWTPGVARVVSDVVARGAAAVVVVTRGQTGGVVAMDVPAGFAGWPVPVVLVGTEREAALDAASAAGAPATVKSEGERATSSAASNFVAHRAGVGKAIVVTAAKTGWFECAGERGSGLAIFLALAHWLPTATRKRLFFAATSGHELGEIGMTKLLSNPALPRPEDVDVWLHLGANAAVNDVSFDWSGKAKVTASVPPRVLYATPQLANAAAKAFAGVPGYGGRPPAKEKAKDDLAAPRAAGYLNVASISGAGPLSHTAMDVAATRLNAPLATAPETLEPVARGARAFLEAMA